MNNYDPSKMNAASLRFIGSLINTCTGPTPGAGEHPSWYHQRTQFDITPGLLTDEAMRQVFEAIEHGAKESGDFMFTPYEIALHMAELGYVQSFNGDSAATLKAYATSIADLGMSGATSKPEFLRLEGLITEVLKDAKAAGVMGELQAIWNKQTSSSTLDKLEQLHDYLSNVRGQFVPQTRSAGPEAQGAILAQMEADLVAKEGQLEESFPRHWGITAQSVKPRRKEMVVISGPSGGGKSILIHTMGEWWARVLHKRVLFLLTEDSIETTLIRAAARHIPYTTFKEVDEVDNFNKKGKFAQMILDWKAQGGEIVYEEVGGMTPMAIRSLIEKKLIQAKLQGIPFDMVCLDYFQDADFDTEAEQLKSTRVAVAARFAVQLRALATKYNIVMVVASQETVDGDEVKTAWSKRLTEKAQVWLRFVTATAIEDVYVHLQFFNKGDSRNGIQRMVALAGEALPFMFMSIAKGNRARQGQRTILFRLGQSQAAYDLGFYNEIRKDQAKEWEPIVFVRPGENFYAKQADMFKVADATVQQLDAKEFDPVRKKVPAKRHIPG